MDRHPIFFAVTRSFLLGWLPAVLTFIDVLMGLSGDPALAGPVASFIAAFVQMVAEFVSAVYPIEVNVTATEIEATMRALAPIYALVVAHQRRGAARPYTADPRALK